MGFTACPAPGLFFNGNRQGIEKIKKSQLSQNVGLVGADKSCYSEIEKGPAYPDERIL